MKIEEGLDEGPYMRQIKVKIGKDTSAKDLSDKLSILGAKNIGIDTIFFNYHNVIFPKDIITIDYLKDLKLYL